MKSILLIGLGRFGKHIAMHLNHLGHQVMAVDTSEERVEDVLPIVTNAQIGDSTNADFLESLGVRNYDVCIVAIGNNFQSSLETTSLLSELGARFVVSRAATDVQEKFLLRNGANEVVYPEKQLAKWTAIRYSADHILDYIELDENHAMFEIPVPKDWADHSIGELDIRKKFNINIMGIKKSGKLELSISSDTVELGGESMQDVILLVSTSAIFIFGYFMVKKLDAFLENNWNEQEHALIHGENSLKIGFSNPLMADSLSDVLETYGKQHPDVFIHIFSGEDSELCRELETHELDIIFLPENTAVSEKIHYNARIVILRCTPVVMKYAGLSIEPIAQNHITQKALWRNSKKTPVIDSFIGCMNRLAVNQSQM